MRRSVDNNFGQPAQDGFHVENRIDSRIRRARVSSATLDVHTDVDTAAIPKHALVLGSDRHNNGSRMRIQIPIERLGALMG